MKKYISNVIITELIINENKETNYLIKIKSDNSIKEYTLFESESGDDAEIVKNDTEFQITKDMYILIKNNIRDNYIVEIDLDNKKVTNIRWIR